MFKVQKGTKNIPLPNMNLRQSYSELFYVVTDAKQKPAVGFFDVVGCIDSIDIAIILRYGGNLIRSDKDKSTERCVEQLCNDVVGTDCILHI